MPARRTGAGPRTCWLWLEVGPERQAALHEVPLVALDLAGARARIRPLAPGAVILPLLAEPAPAPPVPEGTLVKGSADDLFYVEGGHLRWVPGMGCWSGAASRGA